jgi:ribosomal protein S12
MNVALNQLRLAQEISPKHASGITTLIDVWNGILDLNALMAAQTEYAIQHNQIVLLVGNVNQLLTKHINLQIVNGVIVHIANITAQTEHAIQDRNALLVGNVKRLMTKYISIQTVSGVIFHIAHITAQTEYAIQHRQQIKHQLQA